MVSVGKRSFCSPADNSSMWFFTAHFLFVHLSVLLHLRLHHSLIYGLPPRVRPHHNLHPHLPSLNTPADMSRPKVGMFAKYVIPQTSFDFALHRKDFRLIWAINCGSYSLVPLVPVYEAHLLDAQLDAVMRWRVVHTCCHSLLSSMIVVYSSNY